MPFINPGDATREIYQFNNGERDICRDPAVIWRRITAACVKPGADGVPGETWEALMRRWGLCIPSVNDTDEIKAAKLADFRMLQGTLAAVTYDAFELKPLDDDGNGVTEEFAMAVLCEFIGAREKKEPSIETSPSESPPMVGDPAITSNAPSGMPGATRRNMGSRSTRRLPTQPQPPSPSSGPSEPR